MCSTGLTSSAQQPLTLIKQNQLRGGQIWTNNDSELETRGYFGPVMSDDECSWCPRCRGLVLSPEGHEQTNYPARTRYRHHQWPINWKDWALKIFQKINNDCRMGRWLICDRHPDMLRPQDRNSKILPVWEIRVPSHRSNCFLDHQWILLSHRIKSNVACSGPGQLKFNWTDLIRNTRHHSATVWVITLNHLALLVSDVYDEEMVLIPRL